MSKAAIIRRGKILAIFDTDLPAQQVECSYYGDKEEGVLYGPFFAKLTRNKRILESRDARECLSSANLIYNSWIYPRIIIND